MKKIFSILVAGSFLTACGSNSTNNQSETKKSEQISDNSGDTITILQTADIHGQLEVHDELFWENDEITFRRLGGMANMKTLFDMERNKNPEGTIILDGGDLIQGGAVAALSEGAAFSNIVKSMNYDFLIPGNWEVVYGKEKMINVLKAYDTPVIAANMYDDETEEFIFPPYFIKDVKGVKVGFISYNDPDIPVRQNPSFSKGIRFDQVHKNLATLVNELKDEKKVDVLFVVTHIGISKQFDLSNDPTLSKVDYILGNDTHERIREPLQGEFSKVTEPGAFASFVGKLQLVVKDGKIEYEDYELMEVDPKIYAPDQKVAAVIEEETAPYKENISRILGYTSTPMYRYFVVENPMDNFITDAARWKTGADISISNGFRFSPPLVPGKDGKAEITYEYLWNMLPVNEYVKTGKATGQQIHDWMEQEIHNVFAKNPKEKFGGWLVRFSGMTLKFDSSKPKGERVIEIKVGEEALDLKKVYTVSACRREGEPDHMLCRMPNLTETEVKEYTVHEVLEEYLNEKGTISPVRDGRAQAVDLGDNVLSQMPESGYHFH
ncbi:bifunctional metallophosphatase/5'-nucleotidase [Brumimicrobium mesophilum]|uniref:bifunctional metallophosphatase/5'-nucleotidase n=1 Tax=Brumimicrobium mesophilum TaxID=392717 RepID=UPI000D140DB3|nr:bifunctional metallophosphatase/5'-nucleotidase [Brumimicrobium mesophilum]